jgi:hypothetical protein
VKEGQLSRTMIVYFLMVVVISVPGVLAMRRVPRDNLVEQVIGGVLVAVVWPVAIPVLSLSKLNRVRQNATRRGVGAGSASVSVAAASGSPAQASVSAAS